VFVRRKAFVFRRSFVAALAILLLLWSGWASGLWLAPVDLGVVPTEAQGYFVGLSFLSFRKQFVVQLGSAYTTAVQHH
jgi:hypothetical protein